MKPVLLNHYVSPSQLLVLALYIRCNTPLSISERVILHCVMLYALLLVAVVMPVVNAQPTNEHVMAIH
jgi:hypothetical protein